MKPMDTAKDNKAQFPSYKDNKTMYLGVFSSPAPTAEAYRICAEAGFNTVLLDHNYGAPGTETFQRLYAYCQQAGLKAVPMRINKSMSTLYDTNPKQHAAFDGIYVWDEPSMREFDMIANWAERFDQEYRGHKFLVNLFPSFATPDMLGTEDYERYVCAFVNKVLTKLRGYKQLSVDHYALLTGAEGRKPYIAEGWLRDLETLSRIAMGTDIVTHYYILTIRHQIFRALTSATDVRFQYAVAMAYGFKAFSVFTYPTQNNEDWGNGLVTQTLTQSGWITVKHPAYEYVRMVNEELLNFDHVYLSFEYCGTMPVIGAENEFGANECFAQLRAPLERLPGVVTVRSERDALIGAFADRAGNHGYMFVNFTEPSESLSNRMEIIFDKSEYARLYIQGEPQDHYLTDGCLVLDLKPGEGVFAIVI